MGMGFHFQREVKDWDKAVAKQPKYTPNKTFTVQQAPIMIKANPYTLPILRHWYDPDQVFGGDYENRARKFLNSFIDETFMQYAKYVKYVEGWNEYLANSQNEDEVNERIAWATALAKVWKTEYRTKPELSHIKVVLGNTAIGNDIPLGIAKAAYYHDAVLGYHPYMPVRNGVPYTYRKAVAQFESLEIPPVMRAKMTVDEPYPVFIPLTRSVVEAVSSPENVMDDGRKYFWLRWQVMDAGYRAHNIYPKWLFTEFNPLNYEEHSWGLHLDGGGGWRHPNVCNGNVEQYIALIKLFLDEMTAWNKNHGNRALGGVLFTTSGDMGGTWKLFETVQPEMSKIAEALAAYSPTPPVIPPPTTPLPPTPEPEDPILNEIFNFGKSLVDANNDSALQKAIWEDGWDLAGPEKWFTANNGIKYAAKPAVNSSYPDTIRVYYAEVPNWDQIKWIAG